jgi:hypothetical protein
MCAEQELVVNPRRKSKMSVTLRKKPTVANDFSTVIDVLNWHQGIITPLVPKPEEFQKEKLPHSKEHIEWKRNNMDTRIHNNTLLINLLQGNIIDRKIKGQILSAKNIIKRLKEENNTIKAKKGILYNGGI